MRASRSTTKPSKMRKLLYHAPAHVRGKLMAAPLSAELRKSSGIRTLPVRSGDTVRIERGDHKGIEGKISRVDRRKYRIYLEGLTREKVDGSTISVPIHASKVTITKLNLDDKWRKQILERKKGLHKKREKIIEKPPAEAVKVKEEVLEEKEIPEEKPEGKPEEKVTAKEKPRERKTRTRKKRSAKEPETEQTKKVESAEKAEKAEKAKKKTKEEKKPRARKEKAKRKTAKPKEEQAVG